MSLPYTLFGGSTEPAAPRSALTMRMRQSCAARDMASRSAKRERRMKYAPIPKDYISSHDDVMLHSGRRAQRKRKRMAGGISVQVPTKKTS